jgi:hypothetical protein
VGRSHADLAVARDFGNAFALGGELFAYRKGATPGASYTALNVATTYRITAH